MKKRTKIIILVLMVALLGVTAYLNIALNNRAVDTGSQNQSANYFDGYKATRVDSRNKQIAYYDAIIASTSSSAEAIANAEAKRMEVIAEIEKELAIEWAIKSKGFADVVITNSANNIYVSVKAATLTKAEVAQIVSVVQEQTNKTLENIKIVPVE